jgi:hypothetical protein
VADAAARASAEFRRLPRGAAVYVAARPALIDFAAGLLPGNMSERIRAEIAHVVPVDRFSGEAVARALHLDESRPVLYAVVPGSAAELDAIVAALSRAKVSDEAYALALQQLRELSVAPGGSHRLIIPTEGAPHRLIGLLSELRGARPCPGAQACQRFARQPALLMEGSMHAAVYADDDALRIDAIEGRRGTIDGDAPHLAAFAQSTGGRGALRCASSDTDALLDVCIDADAAAALGSARGLHTMVEVLQAVDPSQRLRLLEAGVKEARRNTELATSTTRLLDAGSFTLHGTATAAEIRGSWWTQPAARGALEGRFAAASCAEGGEAFRHLLLPSLAETMSGARGDFASIDEGLEALLEAGSTAWLVVLARSWPSLLVHLGDSARTKKIDPTSLRLCAQQRGERLELQLNGDLIPIVRD